MLAVAIFSAPATGACVPREIPVGILSYAEHPLTDWKRTLRYLDVALPQYAFRAVPLDLEGMQRAVRNGEVDFVITNPGNYVDLEVAEGISRIASADVGDGARVGAVIFSRADRNDVRSLRDLKGRRFAAVSGEAFGGFRLAWREFALAGVDPYRELRLDFVGFPMERVVRAVLSGEADAGTVKACLLERLAREGDLDMKRLNVLAPKTVPGFACALSTSLYPDWPFAKLRQTPKDLAQEVAIALLRMPAGKGEVRWTVPVDYQPVHELLKSLKVGPYAALPSRTFGDVFMAYWHWFFFAAVMVAWWIVHVVRTEHLVRVRTAELTAMNRALEEEMAERRRAEEEARQRQEALDHAARLSILGEMASSLAHEINQPICAIHNYARGASRRLGSEDQPDRAMLVDVTQRIAGQAERAGAIVQRMRHFARKRDTEHRPFSPGEAVREAVELFGGAAKRHGVVLRLDVPADLPAVWGDNLQTEQVMLNLLQNALDAMQDTRPELREVRVAARLADASTVEVSVEDNGHGLSEPAAARIFEPFFTTKPEGVGLGLSISRSIIETQGGRIWAEPRPEGGLAMRFTLSTLPGGHEDV